ncbi:MAG: class I SAM-dependent methyltransferase [Myxococcales bacterium]|nr:class I SAM-dependent methyltransferase [Myxococcales bacterium]
MRHTAFLLLLACGGATPAATTTPTEAPADAQAVDVPSGDLAAAMAGPHRTEEERARDVWRHPAETLAFFEVAPGKDVVELAPGGGWYTKLLAPLLRESGSLTVGLPDGQYGDRFRAMAAEAPHLYGHVRQGRLAPPEAIELGEPESADVVLTFRNTHGWVRNGVERQVYEAAFRVLRPGGIFGVVQHRAPEGSDLDIASGYVTEAAVIEAATAVGFELVERSDINANPNDTHDHPDGVWSLPPSLRGEGDNARFVAIGESDRMTLKFRRPAS